MDECQSDEASLVDSPNAIKSEKGLMKGRKQGAWLPINFLHIAKSNDSLFRSMSSVFSINRLFVHPDFFVKNVGKKIVLPVLRNGAISEAFPWCNQGGSEEENVLREQSRSHSSQP